MFKGILVGVDDRACNFNKENPSGGYCWILHEKDWDNGSNVATDKIYRNYKISDVFHIYFFVFKTKSLYPASNSDDFRNKIFGFADVIEVEKNRYKKDYKHHVKIDNVRLFTPKIELELIINELEYYYDWSDSQFDRFGNSLATHGLLLTKNDCERLQEFRITNIE